LWKCGTGEPELLPDPTIPLDVVGVVGVVGVVDAATEVFVFEELDVVLELAVVLDDDVEDVVVELV
jgi:hypothetical protein